MTVVLSETGEKVIGWSDHIPVMWDNTLGRWLNARELECLGKNESAFQLWKKVDPEWGEPWNQGVKDRYPVDLPVYPTPKGEVPITMIYNDSNPAPQGEVSRAEIYWLKQADGTRKEVQWEEGQWIPFFPRPYQQTL